MIEITLEHIRKAAEWAKDASEPRPLDGETRTYDQGTWDCGTSCCIWGAAHLLAGNGKTDCGPPDEWGTDARRKIILALLRSGATIPDQIISVLDSANLREANLREANLSWANLSEADLSGTDLSWADLSGADLRKANLSEANLSKANLSKADLREADLSKADLSKADLSGADLRGANLHGADLSEADLSGANLSGTLITISNVIRTIK